MRKPHTTDDKMLDSRPVFEFVVVLMWLRRLNYDASGGWASDERKKGWLAAAAGMVIDGRRIRPNVFVYSGSCWLRIGLRIGSRY